MGSCTSLCASCCRRRVNAPCSTSGCSRSSWNGCRGEPCCRTCRWSEGQEHGDHCNYVHGVTRAECSKCLDYLLCSAFPFWSSGICQGCLDEPECEWEECENHRVCGKKACNGRAGTFCCDECDVSDGGNHGSRCGPLGGPCDVGGEPLSLKRKALFDNWCFPGLEERVSRRRVVKRQGVEWASKISQRILNSRQGDL